MAPAGGVGPAVIARGSSRSAIAVLFGQCCAEVQHERIGVAPNSARMPEKRSSEHTRRTPGVHPTGGVLVRTDEQSGELSHE